MKLADYEARVARVLKNAERPTMKELIADGGDLDERVNLPSEPEWEHLKVPEDTMPGE